MRRIPKYTWIIDPRNGNKICQLACDVQTHDVIHVKQFTNWQDGYLEPRAGEIMPKFFADALRALFA